MKLLDILFLYLTNFAETTLDQDGLIVHWVHDDVNISLNGKLVYYIKQTKTHYSVYSNLDSLIDTQPNDNINQWEFEVFK